jgi:multiple sugar transport system permease protein
MATTAGMSRTALKRRGASKQRSAWLRPETRTALLFLLPSFIGFMVFYAIPAVRGFYLSFTNWDLLKQSGETVGVDNYKAMFQDALFWNALGRTFEYVVINIGIQTVLALAIAVLMHRLTGSIVVRGILVLPWLIPNVVLALLWMWMLDPNLGIVNHWLTAVGLPSQGFLGSEGQVIPTIAGINIWRHMGYTALLLFGGLVMIPKSFYEAAAIDGASGRQQLFRITLPLMSRTTGLIVVLQLVASLKIFDQIYLMTDGGPNYATRPIIQYIYESGFTSYRIGYASAVSYMFFVVIVIVSVAQFKLFSSRKEAGR